MSKSIIKDFPLNTGFYMDTDVTGRTGNEIDMMRAIPYVSTRIVMTFPNRGILKPEDFEVTTTKTTTGLQYNSILLNDIRDTIIKNMATHNKVEVPSDIAEVYIGLNFHMIQLLVDNTVGRLAIITSYDNKKFNTYFKLGGTKFYFKVSSEDNFKYHVNTPIGIFGVSEIQNQYPTLII